MKHPCTPLAILLAATASANVSVPETTPDVNAQTVYAKGEGAYAVVSDSREARLYVGGDNGEALSVVDASAIRGEMQRVLPTDALRFDTSSNIERTGNTTFRWTDTKTAYDAGDSWLRVIAADGGSVDGLSFGLETVSVSGGIGASVSASSAPDGTAYRVTLDWGSWATSGVFDVTNLVAYRVDQSTIGNATDATRNVFRITDSRGTFELGTVRQAIYEEIDRTSGERWAQWEASGTAKLAGQALAFDAEKTIFMRWLDDALGLYVGGSRAIEVAVGGSGDGQTDGATAITVTGFAATLADDADHARISFTIAHTGGLDESAIAILRADTLNGLYAEVSHTIESRAATDGGTAYTALVAKDASATAAFYRVAYSGVSATVQVIFNAPVVFNASATAADALSAGAVGQRVAAAEIADGALALTLDASVSIHTATLDADLAALTVTAAFADESDAYARTWEILLDASACEADVALTWPEDWLWLESSDTLTAGKRALYAVRRMPDGTVLANTQGEY